VSPEGPGAIRPLPGLAEFIIESALDGLVVINTEGKIIAFNAAAGHIFGVDPASMINRTLEPLFVPGMFVQHQHYIQGYLRGEGRGVMGGVIETEGWHSSGRRVPLEIGLSEASLGEERAFLACIRDITRRREDAERQRAFRQLVVRAQRIESLGTLSAGMAHDFANTLGAIMGYASAVLHELPRTDPQYADVAQILALAHRARGLTDSLLGFSGPADPCSEPVGLSRAVRSVLSMLRRSLPRTIRIKLRLTQEACVEGDAAQLEQCLMNLCLNARDALPDGGELVLETRRVDLDERQAIEEQLTPGRYCLLAVRDNGIGMDPSTLDRLGRPFFSTKPAGKGRGLGLSVVQTIVKAHGGSVRFMSEPGRGTEVRILLPATDPVAGTRPSASPWQAPRSRGETILIVDDDRALRQMAGRLLGSLGYQVVLAGSGEEALRIYREQRAGIDLVLLDLRLVDMDGSEVLRQLQQIAPSVRVLVSSGVQRGEEPARLQQQGACGFLAKPYGIEEISEAIGQALRRGELSG